MQELADPHKRIQRIIQGPQLGALLYSVLSYQIPRLLSSGPRTAEEMSSEIGFPKDRLERVMLALETEKIFDYNLQSNQFSLNAVSQIFLNEPFQDYVKLGLAPWMFEF